DLEEPMPASFSASRERNEKLAVFRHRTARIRFATDHAFSGRKSRLGTLRHVNGIQFFDKPVLRHSQTLREEKESFPLPKSELRGTSRGLAHIRGREIRDECTPR